MANCGLYTEPSDTLGSEVDACQLYLIGSGINTHVFSDPHTYLFEAFMSIVAVIIIVAVAILVVVVSRSSGGQACQVVASSSCSLPEAWAAKLAKTIYCVSLDSIASRSSYFLPESREAKLAILPVFTQLVLLGVHEARDIMGQAVPSAGGGSNGSGLVRRV